jgi:CheY-like chemotaxis protein
VAGILLVEDNEMNRDLLFRRLKLKGYGVDVSENGPGDSHWQCLSDGAGS